MNLALPFLNASLRLRASRFAQLALAASIAIGTGKARAEESSPASDATPRIAGEAATQTQARSDRTLETGALMFAVSYGAVGAIALFGIVKPEDKYNANELFVPVAGPIISIVTMSRNIHRCNQHHKDHPAMWGGVDCFASTLGLAFATPVLVVDAVAQGAGLIYLAIGATKGSSGASSSDRTKAYMRPYISGTTAGLTGTF